MALKDIIVVLGLEGQPEIAEVLVEVVGGRGCDLVGGHVDPLDSEVLAGDQRVYGALEGDLGAEDVVLGVQHPPGRRVQHAQGYYLGGAAVLAHSLRFCGLGQGQGAELQDCEQTGISQPIHIVVLVTGGSPHRDLAHEGLIDSKEYTGIRGGGSTCTGPIRLTDVDLPDGLATKEERLVDDVARVARRLAV